MRRLFVVGILLLAGCQGVSGPFSRPPGRVDDPLLTISEQKARARERLALPDESQTVGPRLGIIPPDGPYGSPR